MAVEPDVRIGQYWYRLNEGQDETGLLGIHPMTRPWSSIFPARQGLPGNPGIQNVHADDLRWEQTIFDGGEGQRVIDATSQSSFRTFDRSVGIDLSVPSYLQIAKAMTQQGLTGAAGTTVEGSSFVDDGGTSTVVNTTDRRLNALGNAIQMTTPTLAVASWQFDIYAYPDAPRQILGSVFAAHEINPTVNVDGTSAKFGPGSEAQSTLESSLPAGPVTLTFHSTFDDATRAASVHFLITVIDADTGAELAKSNHTVDVHGPTPDVRVLTFQAKAGHNYRYHYRLVDHNCSVAPHLNYVEVDPADPKQLTWQIKDGVTVLASGTTTLTAPLTTANKVASGTIASEGNSYTVRLVYASGTSRKPIVDKVVYTQVTLHDPRALELGYDSKAWLVDHSDTGAAAALWWDPQTQKWTAVGTFGPVGAKAIALAHSDNYEFVGMDDKKVYRIRKPSTIAAYTGATTDPLVGIAAGGNRLFVLTEATATGTTLFDGALEGTPPVALTSRYAVGNLGVVSDLDLPQRIAPTLNGAVFFANQGPDCFVYRWDGTTGSPMCKMPTGFRGSAIAYGNGLTWLAGSFPAADIDGTTRHRPAIFQIDSSNNPSELGVFLWRDDDPSTRLRALQLYGTDLYVLAEVSTTPMKMRLWRISLQTIAAFLHQEVTTDATQQAATSRGLAITFLDKIAIWGKGNPYLESQVYQTTGESSLVSSRYTFSLTEFKELIALDVNGLIPAGTAVDVFYSVDEGPFVMGGTWTTPGRQAISIPDGHVFFQTLQIRTVLRTSINTITPRVYAIAVRGYLQTYDRSFDLVLRCFEESSVYHMNGQQVRGSVGVAYLYSLADAGGVVEFEDRYSSELGSDAQVHVVSIADPKATYIRKGEAYVSVKLTERGV